LKYQERNESDVRVVSGKGQITKFMTAWVEYNQFLVNVSFNLAFEENKIQVGYWDNFYLLILERKRGVGC
jgi:hypothetical protein